MSAKVLKTWDEHRLHLRGVLGGFADRRTGDNIKYSMQDIGLGAFSVFFTQCPSFLAHQKTMQQAKGQSNAQSLFHLEQLPCDNHIREMLDPVPPERLFPATIRSWRVYARPAIWRVGAPSRTSCSSHWMAPGITRRKRSTALTALVWSTKAATKPIIIARSHR